MLEQEKRERKIQITNIRSNILNFSTDPTYFESLLSVNYKT